MACHCFLCHSHVVLCLVLMYNFEYNTKLGNERTSNKKQRFECGNIKRLYVFQLIFQSTINDFRCFVCLVSYMSLIAGENICLPTN